MTVFLGNAAAVLFAISGLLAVVALVMPKVATALLPVGLLLVSIAGLLLALR